MRKKFTGKDCWNPGAHLAGRRKPAMAGDGLRERTCQASAPPSAPEPAGQPKD